mgnify:CR=1 FL=1
MNLYPMEVITLIFILFELILRKYMDADQLHWPLLFRGWQQGDRMRPLGMKNTKKLSDIFIDEKHIITHFKNDFNFLVLVIGCITSK